MSHAAAVVAVGADAAATRAVNRLPSGRLGSQRRTALSRDAGRRGRPAVDEMPAVRVMLTVAAVGARRFRGSVVVATRMTRGSSSSAWMRRLRLLIVGLLLTTNCCPKAASIAYGTCRVGWKPSALSSPATWTAGSSRLAVEATSTGRSPAGTKDVASTILPGLRGECRLVGTLRVAQESRSSGMPACFLSNGAKARCPWKKLSMAFFHLGQPPKTPRVFGITDRRIQAAADYFRSL